MTPGSAPPAGSLPAESPEPFSEELSLPAFEPLGWLSEVEPEPLTLGASPPEVDAPAEDSPVAASVGVLYQKEVDFVAAKQGQRLYIQVSDDISQESTFEREITPLRKIRDAYPKAIIAKTGHEVTDWDGIKVIDLGRWLMGQTGEFDA